MVSERCKHIQGNDVDTQVEKNEFPKILQPVIQKDAWSCGYHVLARVEECFREWRGEGVRRVYATPRELWESMNRWIDMLLKFKSNEELKKAGPPPAGEASKVEWKSDSTMLLNITGNS